MQIPPYSCLVLNRKIRNTESVKERNRQAIIDAAGELASTRGIGSFTAVDLAERAGTSRRSIFNHFHSADDAVYAYLSQCLEGLFERASNIGESTGSADDLISYLQRTVLLDESYEILEHISAVISTDARRSGTLAWASQIIERAANVLADAVRHAVPNVSDVDAHLLSHTIISAIQTAQALWVNMSEEHKGSREEWNSLHHRALELVRIGPVALRADSAI